MKAISPINPSATLHKDIKHNKKIAQDTLKILKNKSYINQLGEVVNIANELDHAISNSKYYDNNYKLLKSNSPTSNVEITNETTTQAAVKLLAQGKTNIVALNFASARNPGGGWLHGAVAQEEDLARCSGLYSCLQSKPLYYNANLLKNDSLYTDGMIYSPNVPFFRDNNLLLLDKPYLLSIITAPAPNVSQIQIDTKTITNLLNNRIRKIFQVLKENNHTNVILGAWGCGCFGNDPELVSSLFKEALKDYNFEQVIFATYDKRPNTPIFNTFKKNF